MHALINVIEKEEKMDIQNNNELHEIDAQMDMLEAKLDKMSHSIYDDKGNAKPYGFKTQLWNLFGGKK